MDESKLETISIGGQSFKLLKFPDVTREELEHRLALALAVIKAWESQVSDDIHSLPETIQVGGQYANTWSMRMHTAVALGESSSWVSDKEVVESIARYGKWV